MDDPTSATNYVLTDMNALPSNLSTCTVTWQVNILNGPTGTETSVAASGASFPAYDSTTRTFDWSAMT